MAKAKTDIINDLEKINEKICRSIWKMVCANSTKIDIFIPHLIFPIKTDKLKDANLTDTKIRISEQESRIIYCNILNDSDYFYSIETPTIRDYKQSGNKYTSARSDMSLYEFDNNKFKKLVNVELKANNCDEENIRKDIEKIAGEGLIANWFHTIKNIDSGTLGSIFNKFKAPIKKYMNAESEDIVFCFCIVEKQIALIKVFESLKLASQGDSYIKEFFEFEYSIKNGEVEIDNSNDWIIVK